MNFSAVGSILGGGVTVLIEFIYAAYSIGQAKKRWKEGILIKSREEFIEKVISVLVVFLSRCGCNIAGMLLGQIFIPIPFAGSIIGLLAGSIVGHYLGQRISEKYSPRLTAQWLKLSPSIGNLCLKIKEIFHL